MPSNNSVLKRAWLLPLVAITIAAMALAYWAATSNNAAADSHNGNSGATGAYRTDLIALGAADVGGAGIGDWETILEGDVKVSQNEDVVANVSVECGLFTDTTVRSKGGSKDISYSKAMVRMRVSYTDADGTVRTSQPGEVIFCSRAQTLMASFGGVMNSCEDLDGDGVITFAECDFDPEELRLMLDTVNANAFNFIQLDLPVGVHHIVVEAELSVDTELSGTKLGDVDAKAWIGKGSVAVNEVKFAKSENLGQLP